MVAEQSWSSFHHKYGSETYRRSSKYDRDHHDHDDGVSGIVRTLLKKCSSSRKLMVPEENILLSRSSISSSSSARNSFARSKSERKIRPSLSISASFTSKSNRSKSEANIILALDKSASSTSKFTKKNTLSARMA